MQPLFVGQNSIQLSSVDSTNNFAANLIKGTNVPDGTVILSDEQTEGRGQRGNVWQAEKGKNLTCTYILFPSFIGAVEQFDLSIAVALSIADTLLDYGVTGVGLKWPNDVRIGRKKICGVLIETSIQGRVLSNALVGIGLNLNQNNFGEGVVATSLSNELGKGVSIPEVVGQLNVRLEQRYLLLKAGKKDQQKSEYLQLLYGYRTMQQYRIVETGEEISLEIRDVLPTGQLLLVDLSERFYEFSFKELMLLS